MKVGDLLMQLQEDGSLKPVIVLDDCWDDLGKVLVMKGKPVWVWQQDLQYSNGKRVLDYEGR